MRTPNRCTWLLCAALCSAAAGSSAETSARLAVAVGIAPYADLVRRVAGETVRIHTAVPPGQSHETYQPSAKQIAALSDCRLYFSADLPFERVLIPKLAGIAPALEVVSLRRGVPLRAMTDDETECAHDHAHEHDHDHHAGEPDPHIWLAPQLLAIQVETIADALARLLPHHAADVRTNAEAVRAECDQLDAELRQLLEPLRGRPLYVYHPAFGYFADAYGLRQVAVEAGGKEPTAKQLGALIERARGEEVKVIFVQPQFPQTSARAVAAAIGGAVVALDPLAPDALANLREIGAQIRAAFPSP